MAKRALVVDDSATVRQMVRTTLEGENFEILTAQDGAKALKLAAEQELDVIITDINMPNMDGIEMIRMFRETTLHKFTPILVLTTEGGEKVKQAGKEAGASGWIVKPFKPDVMIKAVRKVCGL